MRSAEHEQRPPSLTRLASIGCWEGASPTARLSYDHRSIFHAWTVSYSYQLGQLTCHSTRPLRHLPGGTR